MKYLGRLGRVCRALCVLAACAGAHATAPPAEKIGLQADVVLDDYCEYSSPAQLMRRLLSPLAAAQVTRRLAQSQATLPAHALDLAAERFTVYVPRQAPPAGYALLVFISPWDDAPVPSGWEPVLEEHGVIFVSATHSGNKADVLARREPLALLAACNLMQRYRVDPRRVYIGGFSGGSRIAMRLALGYPDLFRGALLNAGSDPLGAGPPPLPPRDLFERFQQSTRLAYLTGERDTLHLSMDADSQASMRKWCVFDVATRVTPGASHEIANPTALAWALGALAEDAAPDPARLAACRAGIERELAAALAQAESAAGAGRESKARKLLGELDQRFGGLAAPASVALLDKIGG